jgi:hypothetical protein
VSLKLSLGERQLECRDGYFCIHVQTERWVEPRFGPVRLPGRWSYDPSLAYAIIELEIEVDENSGDDGEPAPSLEIECPPNRWNASAIREISGSIWQDGDGARVVGWYGNDSPEIEGSAISFGSWSEGQGIAVEWTGSYRWRQNDPAEGFRLTGSVKFTGLHLSVKSQIDADKFLAAALPGFGLDGLELQPVEAFDHGPEMPDKSRRHWERHQWNLKRSA